MHVCVFIIQAHHYIVYSTNLPFTNFHQQHSWFHMQWFHVSLSGQCLSRSVALTFLSSTLISLLHLFLRATWSTALFSVALIFSPLNMASLIFSTLRAFAWPCKHTISTVVNFTHKQHNHALITLQAACLAQILQWYKTI